MQRIVHVEPPSQLMLPLGPTVTSHVEPPLQLTLHDDPHDPVHSFWSVQPSEQLELLQLESPMSHVSPIGQVHDEPVHSGGAALLPQPMTTVAAVAHKIETKLVIVTLMFWLPPGSRFSS